MTVDNLKDLVYYKYMVECKRRKQPEIEWGWGEFYFMYDLVAQDIIKRLNVIDMS